MKKVTIVVMVLLVSTMLYGQRITESLSNWTLGTNAPEIGSGPRGDGTSGGYIHMLVGTSPMYYEVAVEGEGGADFWVYDPGKCLENLDPGYGLNGPRWGLQSLLYQSVSVGIGRPDYVSGCQGYSPWSTVAPYSFTWFKDCVRASHGCAFTPGWYQWSVYGTWDNVIFTLYNVTYEIEDGLPHDDYTTGDCVQTYDATTFGGMWAALFGDGWKALWLKGDEASGIEDVYIDVTGGSGVFDELGVSGLNRPYVESSWGAVKSLYR